MRERPTNGGIHCGESFTAKPRTERININQDFEVRDWADRFRVSPEQLREAIRAGTIAALRERILAVWA